MDIKLKEDDNPLKQFNLMEIIFNPSKHSPPNSFIDTLKKRYSVYYAVCDIPPKVGFIVH